MGITRMEIKGGVAEIQKDRNTPLVPKVSQLSNEKETIYRALDKWVAWENEFPLIAAAKALQIFKKRSQWLCAIQVYSIFWYSCFVFSSF
ncbi:hypothetical protein Gotri_026052 [Gossypium trilobum]|uniref:Uncharacterized protein n=1 Tax=Gossypium trilobum TaxID=34281 RepID=A0A7J9FLC5_9ROSI|nr:hypothetical protein [Gossypium trilobum]